MPPPNNPAVVRVAMLFTRDTRTFVNTFHVARVGLWGSANMLTLANLFADWWNTNYKTLSWAGVALTQIQVRLYDPSNPLAVDQSLTTPVAGSKPGAPDPASASLSTSWRTGLAGRKYRGRYYTVGMTEGDSQDNDSVTTGYTVAAGVIGSQLLANIIAAGLSLVVFHRVDNTITPILSVIVENLVDSQRRRLAGRGR